MENEEIRSIINAIGAGFLDTFDISKMKYGKIVILTDKDFDGDHIRALLITFFFRFMPELVKAGRLYAGVPPLFRVIQGKNIHYCRTEKEKDEVLTELKKKGISNYLVTRFKGLGEMNPSDLYDTTLNPKTRDLIRITVEDYADTDEVITSLMGSETLGRKKLVLEGV